MRQNMILTKLFTWLRSLEKSQGAFLGIGMAALLLVSISEMAVELQKPQETIAAGVTESENVETEYIETEKSPIMEELLPETSQTENSEMVNLEVGTEETEQTEIVEVISVSMKTTSIQQDLKIKIVNDKNRLVTGKNFVISVIPEGEKTGSTYSDKDKDGIIYITSIKGGKYTILLQDMEGIEIAKNTIQATVKEKIVYEKVEIEDEIKNESEIDASKEDTPNKNIEVENEIKDTLPLLESQVLMTEVPKEQVVLDAFPDAAVSEEKNSISLHQILVTEKPNGGSADGNPDVGNTDTGSVDTGGSGIQETFTEILATAEVSLPEFVTMYPCGKESSTSSSISLQIADSSAIITGITWNISDTTIAEVVEGEEPNSFRIMAKKIGAAVFTAEITYQETAESTAVQTVFCTILVREYEEDTVRLSDIEGNLLYADTEAKVIATQKNYTTAEKFYTNPQYIGWQTFDNKQYYYTEEHIPAIGMHFIGGIKYEFNQDGSMIEKEETVGIDVSKWQGVIDWKAVADAGIDFAIIRCGYRGSANGMLVEDPTFKANIEGAIQNGIKVGVYFFSQAITEVEAIEEASMAIAMTSGYQIQMPIYIDTEWSYGRGDRINKETRTRVVKAFCETIKSAGYKAGIYASKSWYYDYLDASQLSFYHIWVAQYNTECDYTGRYDTWQYSDKGTIPGINEKVDMNICYTKY